MAPLPPREPPDAPPAQRRPTGSGLYLQPITREEAFQFVRLHHRHLPPPAGHKFSIAVSDGEQVRGVVIVGRPVARALDDGLTLEVTRLATDGTPNACSKLYGAAWRAAQALGYRRLITYTMSQEPGSSLRACGFRALYQTRGGEWNTPARPRLPVRHPQAKTLWELQAEAH